MKNVIENINYYKARSADKLQSQQVAYIPYLEPDQIECTMSTYHMDGKRILVNQTTHLCFRLRYLKFKPIPYRIKAKYLNINTSMVKLVGDGIIHPFALFINGIFIPWDIMSISICPEAAYLILDLTGLDGKFLNLASGIKYAQILTFPDYVSYITGPSPSDYGIALFSFNEDGHFDMNSPAYSYVLVGEPHLCMCSLTSDQPINAVNVLNYMIDDAGRPVDLTDIKLVKENVILFVNGLFALGEKENIKRTTDLDYASEDYDDYAPRLEFHQSNENLGKNPDIRFDSTLLTIDGGHNENNDTYDFVICANTAYTNTVDNIADAQIDYVQPIVYNMNNGEQTPEYFETLNTEFELTMDRDKDYNTNVADAIKTMIKYNTNAFNETIRRNSNLEIMEYTGEWVMANMDNEEGTLSIPRRHNAMNEEFIIMLVNGLLYEYDHMIKYRANQCIIPIANINYDDKIEILRFKNANNTVSDLVVGENDGFVYYSPELINDNMVLYTNEPLSSDPYTYPSDGQQYFPIEYSLETNSNGLIRITLTEPFYYGKTLKAAYKNRYVHARYIISSSDDLQYCIDLGDKFAYCNDYSKYIVFFNGRKLDSNLYRLVLPVRNTTPFYEFKLYFSMSVKEGDKIDIIYTPSLMKDIVYIPETELSGKIQVDKNILNYGLGTELYMVWINGKKIPASCIENISSTRLQILSDEKTIYNLCITKYIPDIDILTENFKAETSNWDHVISRLTDSEIYAMLGINPAGLSDIESNAIDSAVSIESVMYELIREQYIMNPRVDITEPFVYDYIDIDTTIVKDYDNGGNILLNAADANNDNNLNIERNQP